MAFWACVFANMFHFGESTCTTFRWVFKIRDLLSCVSSNIWHLWDLINMHCTTLTYHMDLKNLKFLKSEPSCLHAGYPWEPSMTYHTDLKNLYFLGRPLLPFQKCRGGALCPPPRFLRVLVGYGFKFLLQPHILLRLTPDKRIYNFQIPRTTPTNGLKKLLFQGFLEVRKGTPLWNFAKLDQLFEFLGKRWIFLE